MRAFVPGRKAHRRTRLMGALGSGRFQTYMTAVSASLFQTRLLDNEAKKEPPLLKQWA